MTRLTSAERKEVKKIIDPLDLRRADDRKRLMDIWPDFVAGGKTANGFNAVREERAFNDFMAADSGVFDGFAFVDLFHHVFKKTDAIYTAVADDCADVVGPNGKTYHTGADGVTVYFMTENPTKRVDFNRSVYFF